MIAVLVIGLMVGFLWLRRKAKRRMVAGLDRPAIWREPAPGRMARNRKGELL